MAVRPQDMFYIPGSTTFTGPATDPTYGGGGLFGQVYQAMQSPQPASLPLPPAPNPMAGIPTMYTQQAPQNSLAPMGMYQNYKATGQMPAETNSFQPMGSQANSPVTRAMGGMIAGMANPYAPGAMARPSSPVTTSPTVDSMVGSK